MQVTKFNLVTDLQIMLFNVTHSNSNFECNKERGFIDQLYVELAPEQMSLPINDLPYLSPPRFLTVHKFKASLEKIDL